MGYFTAVLDADPVSPAGLVAHHHIQTGYLDEQGLAQLMQRCAAITTEFENVPAAALRTLARTVSSHLQPTASRSARIGRSKKAHLLAAASPARGTR